MAGFGFGTRLRKVAVLVAATLLTVGVLTACGAGATDEAAGPQPTAGSVTVQHKFGETVVPADPKRVVTVGWNDQDFVLALGVVPVAAREFFERYDEFPWVQKATGGKGVPTWGADTIDFEAIAKEQPDVIFAIYEAIDRPTYDKLAQIAPTVIQSDKYADEETPWDVQLLTTGKALGKERPAKDLVDGVTKKIEEAKAANPEFAGKVLVEDFGPENGGHYMLAANDPRRSVFAALGFGTQDVTGDLSEEKLELLDRDLLFVNGASKDQMLESPAFSRLKVVRDGRTLYTSFDSNLSGALTYSGPDALLYALDKLVPQLGNALNGRPVADLAAA